MSEAKVDWRSELEKFRKVVEKPSPCPRPRSCDSYQCDVNRGVIKAFERVDALLAVLRHGTPTEGT